jgi:hypothetical protein
VTAIDDYRRRVRLALTGSVHTARLGESVYRDRTVAIPCLGFLRPGTYELVDDDTPVTCTLCPPDGTYTVHDPNGDPR